MSTGDAIVRKYKINKVLGVYNNSGDTKIVDILYSRLEKNLYQDQDMWFLEPVDKIHERLKSLHSLGINNFNDTQKVLRNFFCTYIMFSLEGSIIYFNGNHFDLEIPNIEVVKDLVLGIINDIYKLNIPNIVINYD